MTNKKECGNIMSRDRNIVKIDGKEEELSQITMLSAKDVQKILQVSQAKAYEIIRSLNAELKEKGFYVLQGKINKEGLLLKKRHRIGKASLS